MASLVIVCLFALVSITLGQALSPRINNGIPLDTFKRFPHHVSIITDTYEGLQRNCSGTIINLRWIISTKSCVEGTRLTINFNRLYRNESADSYSVSMNSANVHFYPTGYDDLALVQLPIILQTTDVVRTISIQRHESLAAGTFAVMPGFNIFQERLTYGMFKVLSNDDCKRIYGSNYDEFLQKCTVGWNNNRHVPCEGNEGGGLIIGWPKNPQLIGVFSTPLSCNADTPAIYMDVTNPQYLNWISTITGSDIPV